MAWVRLSDAAGSYEVTFFSETLAACGDLLREGAPILVTADLKQEGEALRITAATAMSLEQAAQEAGAGMRIWLGAERRRAAYPHHPGARAQGPRPGGAAAPAGRDAGRGDRAARRFNVTPRLAQALKMVPGVERVEEV